MSEYVILRSMYDPGRNSALEGGIKFFPINTLTGEPVTINAEDAEKAFSEAAILYPYLRHFLAVQPLSEYQNDLRRILATYTPRAAQQYPRGESRRVFPAPANAGPLHRPADSIRGKYPPR